MSLEEALKSKITSKDDWDKIVGQHDIYGVNTTLVTARGDNMPSPWWVTREYLRMRYGVYQTSTVTEHVNRHYPHLAVHCSTEDTKMVAYTPDAPSGMSDRQLRTSLGKFLRKFYPYMPDHDIESVVTGHNAEMSNEIEFVSGEDIIAAYDAGVGSCMTSPDSRRSGNPLQAYNAPNIRLAVLRDSGGRVTARSLVYEPAPDDLRFIRCYGDQTLKKRLLRRGYKNGTWLGAKFNTIKVGERRFLMPYLDGADTRGSLHNSCVALVDGVITGISPDVYQKLQAHDSRWSACCTNTSGTIYLDPPVYSIFTRKDAITGEDINTLLQDTSRVYVDGVVGETVNMPEDWVFCHVSSSTRAYVPPEAPTFITRSSLYLDTPELRAYFGFRKLDQTLYPDDQNWYKFLQETTSGYIKPEDTVLVVHSKNLTKYEHKSRVTKKHIKLHKHGPYPVYAETKDDFVKTSTGRKVSTVVHDVETLWNGEVRFRRGLRSMHLSGRDVWYTRDNPPRLESELRYQEQLGVRAAIGAVLGLGGIFYFEGYRYRYGEAPISVLVRYISSVYTSRLDQKALRIYLDRVLAEAEAVEYPSPMPPAISTPETIEEPQPELEIA